MDPIWQFHIFQRGWFNHQPDSNNRVVGPKKGWLVKIGSGQAWGSFSGIYIFPKFLNMSHAQWFKNRSLLWFGFCFCGPTSSAGVNTQSFIDLHHIALHLRTTSVARFMRHSLRVLKLQCLVFCFHTFDTWIVITIGPSRWNWVTCLP